MMAVVEYFRKHRKAQKSILAVLVFFVLAAGIFLVRRPANPNGTASQQGTFTIADPVARQEQLKKLQQDRDHDGLRDWEEALYHTDPHNPDTDGDGTPDGEEVKLGRDPTVPSTSKNPDRPNDLMATSSPLQNTGATSSENLTRQLAERMAKEMIVKRIANPDTAFDPDATAQNLVDDVLGSTPDHTQSSLTAKDIIVGRDDSKAAAQAYQTAMLRIVETNSKSLASKPYVQIFTEAMETQNYEKLNLLDPYLTEYDHIIADLKKLSVPPRFAALHLDYINIIIEQAALARKMREAGNDPLSGLVTLHNYTTLQERFKTLLSKFAAKYQEIGI